MSKIIDGKAFAATLREQIAQDVAKLKQERGITPGLAVVLVGDDPASEVYVRNKGKATTEAGMESFEFKLPSDTYEETLLAKIEELNHDPRVHGILVQLPLPKQIREQAVIEAIDPAKDVDGLHPVNAGKLWADLPGLAPCTPLGCIILLKESVGNLAGMHAVVIGRSKLVGKPIAGLLLREHCTVTICHSRTKDLESQVRKADIVIAAVGMPELVRGDWIKPGAAVIDVGINRVIDFNGKSRLVGDVAFAECAKVAGVITPVPGGVGPMTIACLLRNTLQAARMQHSIFHSSI